VCVYVCVCVCACACINGVDVRSIRRDFPSSGHGRFLVVYIPFISTFTRGGGPFLIIIIVYIIYRVGSFAVLLCSAIMIMRKRENTSAHPVYEYMYCTWQSYSTKPEACPAKTKPSLQCSKTKVFAPIYYIPIYYIAMYYICIVNTTQIKL